jgi:hypothetical protein
VKIKLILRAEYEAEGDDPVKVAQSQSEFDLTPADPGIVDDVLMRLGIALKHYFQMKHPDVMPPCSPEHAAALERLRGQRAVASE